jgi:hypothetical protein
MGFKVGRNNSPIFESTYFVQGSSNLDIFELLIRNCSSTYNPLHGTKITQSALATKSLYNLLFLDGNLERNIDRFELQVRFAKGKESYEVYDAKLIETIKIFRLSMHDLNVSVWQKKLELGTGEEYILRVRTKDRSTLRSSIAIMQKLAGGKDLIANSLGAGVWLAKEIL